ncbi:right-handed parallel beta-helix repeat-containing protein [Haladaptatus pallidirubidus]|uniref:Right handed beta helix domain-containing protein n=1 Tax=Haladaptatus pallidirubidus TaxID=1008152 RepID=A0AAV3UEB0_9EURY|nr:right-handed parallel beta-helix repeat-containing protein [Haladaptatus pallidirubidus]
MGSSSDGTTRRNYLRVAGVALATAIAGCDGISEPNKQSVLAPYGDRFETVADLGRTDADRTGTERVDSVVNRLARDGTLLYFPPGTYRLSNLDLSGRSNCGLVGNRATLLVPPSEQGNWIYGESVRNLLFDGFTLDYTAPTAAPVVAFSVAGRRNALRNLTFEGSREAYPRSGLELEVPDRSASLVVDSLDMRGGSRNGNAIFTHAGDGSLKFVDCRVEDWAEGLYASPHSGPLVVSGGTYANNGIDQIRIGGGTSGARVENTTVRVDNPRNPKAKPNMRGIWLEEGTNAVIDNCSIEITDLTGTYSSGGIVVEKQFGSAKITNTTIQTNQSVPAINIRTPTTEYDPETMPSMDGLPSNHNVTCETVSMYGTAPEGTAVLLAGRDGCKFSDISVQHHFGNRDGITIKDGRGTRIHDARLRVRGTPIVAPGLTPMTQNIKTGGIGSLSQLGESVYDSI